MLGIQKGEFWKDKTKLLLLLILIGAFILRIKFGALTSIPVWYDEGDYLTYAKELGKGLDLHNNWNPRRPFLLPLLWAGFYFLGANEFVIRITLLVFSLAGIYFTYLLGKEMYNKKTGILASFFMSIFWLHLFFTGRLLTDVPSTTLMIAGFYFFWKGYVKDKLGKGLYLAAVFLSLAVFTRAALILAIIPFAVYLIIKEKQKLIINKHLWVSIFLFLVVLSPFFIWLTVKYDNPIQRFTGIGEERFSQKEFHPVSDVLRYVTFFPSYLQWPLLIAFLIGLGLLLFDLVLGYDVLFKKEDLLQKEFILIWISVFILFFGLGATFMEPRYLLPIFPAVFFLASQGIFKVEELITKYKKELALPFIILIVILTAYTQLSFADEQITSKSTSYVQVKDAALWMKEHASPGDFIFSNSDPQVSYYTELPTAGFTSQDVFEKMLKEENTKFLMVSVFEEHPEYIYTYFQDNPSFTPVHGIVDQEERPMVIIYEYKRN